MTVVSVLRLPARPGSDSSRARDLESAASQAAASARAPPRPMTVTSFRVIGDRWTPAGTGCNAQLEPLLADEVAPERSTRRL